MAANWNRMRTMASTDASRGEEPSTATRPVEGEPGVLALYTIGPGAWSCALLPANGIMTLGRSEECAIAINDSSCSRLHAAIEIGATLALSDLGSVNGTFIGKRRIERGEPCPLELGETFFVGDSALVVRASGLRRLDASRVLSVEEGLARLSEKDLEKATGLVLLRARATGRRDAHWLEAILGDGLASSEGWMAQFPGGLWLVVASAGPPGDAAVRERSTLAALARWGIDAEVESTFLAAGTACVQESVLTFVRGGSPLQLRRGPVVIQDHAMESLRRTVGRIAPAQVSVLLLGETGVGKDVVASMVHELSPRHGMPFVRINCASLPEALLESELFGHERGAFTGAVRTKPGLFETAHGGTVFLDEIGELPLSLQAKLLLVLETQELTRVGGLRSMTIDVRFVAATNRDLAAAVAEGRFRSDLFYRLNPVTLVVPPLRERPAEIEPLGRLFLAEAHVRFGVGEVMLTPSAIEALRAYSWPGNVRELRHAIERAVLLADAGWIQAIDLGIGIPDACREAKASSPGSADGVPNNVGTERNRIEATLKACGGNQSRAAELLGIPRRTLVRKIARFGLPRPREFLAAAARGDGSSSGNGSRPA